MIENKETELREKEDALRAIERAIIHAGADTPALISERDRLKIEIGGMLFFIDEKKEKTDRIKAELKEFRKEMEGVKERTAELNKEARGSAVIVQERAYTFLKSEFFDLVAEEFKERSLQMSEEQKAAYEGSFLESALEQGNEVLHCATLLFVGLLADAVTFSENHGGGGGGGNDLKRDDDDDRKWARKCMMAATKMMKPKGKKSKR